MAPKQKGKAMKWLIRAAVVTASMLAWPDVALACICPGYRMPSSPTAYQQWLANFDGVVFRGTVVAVRTVPTFAGREASAQTAEYTFKVERVWKGVTTSEVVIRTAADGSMCGIPFVRGKAYLIAADPPRQTLSLCSIGYELARNEKEFLSALGDGSPSP